MPCPGPLSETSVTVIEEMGIGTDVDGDGHGAGCGGAGSEIGTGSRPAAGHPPSQRHTRPVAAPEPGSATGRKPQRAGVGVSGSVVRGPSPVSDPGPRVMTLAPKRSPPGQTPTPVPVRYRAGIRPAASRTSSHTPAADGPRGSSSGPRHAQPPERPNRSNTPPVRELSGVRAISFFRLTVSKPAKSAGGVER